MTDDAMKDLVTKHDKVIEDLVTSNAKIVASVELLVEAQKESNERQMATNSRLEEISKYLAKQAVFGTKLETMDREVRESFKRRDEAMFDNNKRIHARIDEIANTQKSGNGCNSVRLLAKDVETLNREFVRMSGAEMEQRLRIEKIETSKAADVSPTTIKWAVGLIIAYSIMFGTYVVQSINTLDKSNTKIISMLTRDMKDTDQLMKDWYETNRNSHSDKR